MKKIIIALTLACITLFVGCSCNPTEKLAFSNPWSSTDTTEMPGTTETATYEIDFSTNVSTASDSYKYNQDASLKNKFSMNITEGSYKTELKVLDKDNAKLNGVNLLDAMTVKSDILTKLLVPDPDEPANSDTALIYYKTTAILKGNYVVNGEASEEFDDLIITESYFTRSNLSFAPIYARKLMRTSIASVSVEKSGKVNASFDETCFVSTTEYNQGKYYLETFENRKNDERANQYITAYLTNDFDTINALEHTTRKAYGYTFRTAIDNSGLLLSLRGLKLKKDGSKEISVVDKAYGSPQKVSAKCYATSKVDLGTLGEVQTNCVAFGLSGQNSGRYSLAFFQNEKITPNDIGTVGNVNAMVKYIEPLTAYGTYLCLGALEFTLTSLSATIV